MINNSRPTRAEVSDVANAVLDGTDAVMLSGETSVGKYAVEAVRTMSRIVAAAEEDMLVKGLPPLTEHNKPRTQGGAMARAAAEIGDFLDARFLVAFSQSGDTARRLSRYRSPIPLLAFTPDPATRSQLSLTWGWRPSWARVSTRRTRWSTRWMSCCSSTAAARRGTWS